MKYFRRVYQTEDGVGLTELTIAMAVLLVGIFAVSTMLISGILHIRRAEHTTSAGVLAADLMEQLRRYEWRAIGLAEAEVTATDSTYTTDTAYRSVAGSQADQRVALPSCPATPLCTQIDPSVTKQGADGRDYRIDTFVYWRGVTGGRLVKEVTVAARDPQSGKTLSRVSSSFDGIDPDIGPAPPVVPEGAPSIAPIGNRYTEVGKSTNFLIDADDPDADPLTFSAVGLPPGISLDANQGDVTGTPTTEGTYTVTVTVVDDAVPANPPASATFTWTIIAASAGPVNLALGKPTAQSSSGSGDAGSAAARDGNTDGNAANNSVAITNYQTQPWWSVDLGANSAIGQVKIHNRTDCCSNELGNFYVLSSPAPLSTDLATNLANPQVRFFHLSTTGTVGSSITISFNEDGRYVQIHRAGYGRLNLAEVQLFAAGT